MSGREKEERKGKKRRSGVEAECWRRTLPRGGTRDAAAVIWCPSGAQVYRDVGFYSYLAARCEGTSTKKHTDQHTKEHTHVHTHIHSHN